MHITRNHFDEAAFAVLLSHLLDSADTEALLHLLYLIQERSITNPYDLAHHLHAAHDDESPVPAHRGARAAPKTDRRYRLTFG